MQDFLNLGLKDEILKMIDERGYEIPTPIQAKSIPVAISGRDVMGQAQTGTGKTAAFGIPILNQIQRGRGLQALVLCPTRELAVQVCEEIGFLGRALDIHVLAVYGGQSIEVQFRALKKSPEIIIGTPGRLLDHMRRGTIDLAHLKFLVMDEADEMLDMGFLPDIEKVLEECPPERQTFLFSATLLEDIRVLASRFMVEPELVMVEPELKTIALLQQRYYIVPSRQKIAGLCRILDLEQPKVSLIFCRTKKGADELARLLNRRGYSADALHGDMSQRERDNTMQRFRQGRAKILVATDVAARGLDIEHITHVFNFDLPEDMDSYIHRVGRTGRAGRGGAAISLVEPYQTRLLRNIERHIGKRIESASLPEAESSISIQKDRIISRLRETARTPLGPYDNMARDILDSDEARKILAAALKLLADDEAELETMEFHIEMEESIPDDMRAHVELPLGRNHGMNPRRLVELIVANTSLRPGQIGDIEIQRNCSYVEVPMDHIDEVYQASSKMQGEKKRKPAKDRGGEKKRPVH